MSIFLTEAKRVVEELSFQVREAKKLVFDKPFIQCLAEEIELSKDMTNPLVMFVITESGDITYGGIVETTEQVYDRIFIPLINLKESIEVSERERVVEKAAQLAEECLDLDLKLKKKELLERLLKKD